MSDLSNAIGAIDRRTRALGASETEDPSMMRMETRLPEQVIRHTLSGYVPADDLEDAMRFAEVMARQIVAMVTSTPDSDAQHAAAAVAVAQTLAIGAATERSAGGRLA